MAKRNGSYPPSVHPGIPNLPDTPERWRREPLGIHLKEIKRPVNMKDDELYQLVTIKRSRGGAEKRERLRGKDIKVKSQFYVHEGDFVISKRQIVHGACALIPKELDGAVVSNEYAVLGTGGGLDIDYLKYLSETIHFQQTCFHSSIGVHVEKMIFKLGRWFRWDFNIPPLPEQNKIVRVLSNVDKAIVLVKEITKNSKEQKQAAMQQIMTGQKRLPNFNEDWEEITLGDLGKSYTGLSGKSKDDFGYGEKYIPYLNVFMNSKVDICKLDYVNIHPGENQSLVKYGDILFTTSSETPLEVGMSSVLLEPTDQLYLNSFCFGFRLKSFEKLLPEFAQFLFRSEHVRREIANLAQGSTRYNISKKELLKLKIIIPSLSEQKAIAEFITPFQREIENRGGQLAQIKKIKRALIQQLFSGGRRVKVDNDKVISY